MAAEVVADATLLSWTVGTDATSGLDRQVFMIDGSDVATMGTGVDNRNAPSLADGPHTWQIGTIDRAGNRTNSAPRTFVVDHTAPNAPVLVSPLTIGDGTYFWTVHAYDNLGRTSDATRSFLVDTSAPQAAQFADAPSAWQRGSLSVSRRVGGLEPSRSSYSPACVSSASR